MKLLMVCMGNICRSPLMEGWLQAAISHTPGLAHVEVDSAAIGPWHVGRPPDPRAIRVAATHGVDVAMQRARQLKPADFNRFDLILFADTDTLRDGRSLSRGAGAAQVARYLDWAEADGECDIADPYYGDMQDFEQAWRRIGEGGERIIRRLQDKRTA